MCASACSYTVACAHRAAEVNVCVSVTVSICVLPIAGLECVCASLDMCACSFTSISQYISVISTIKGQYGTSDGSAQRKCACLCVSMKSGDTGGISGREYDIAENWKGKL